jgi:hypothetical protein
MPMNLTSIFTKWELPAERNFGWKMKTLDSAKTSFTILNDGVYKLNIEHEIIKGVTPQMLCWWFKNIDGDMYYKGKLYPKYLVWHPTDHIHWQYQNGAGAKIGINSTFRIVEAFGGEKKYLIDSTEVVEKLDETGIRLVRRIGSIEIFSLQHDFIANGNNTIYKSEMIVGTYTRPFNILFNYCIRPFLFTKHMGYAWLKHNIEEVGNFEFFLPNLFAEQKEMKQL